LVERQNANDYMDAAQALHTMFRNFATARTQYADDKGPMDFEAIKPIARGIVTLVVNADGRIAAWRKALEDGKLSREPDSTLPDYNHQLWRLQTDKLATYADPQMASGVPVYQFYQAAAIHKQYVLRELLPKHGIYVI
jgi:hypothetical protein